MNKGKILVLGRNGQLGAAFSALLGDNAIFTDQQDVDFMDQQFTSKLDQRVGRQSLFAVINASAYTAVDKAETEDAEAFRVNARAAEELGTWCRDRRLPVVHFSTDYVFDGSGSKPWTEEDRTGAINAYGASKRLGELLLSENSGDHLILRTSWVYDATRKNFFTTIRRLLNEKPELKVVSDQVGAPTYAPHLAQAAMKALTMALAASTFPSGIYHLCNAGETSWHGFAQAIFEHERARNPNLMCRNILPIPSSEYPLPAKRPLNSRLDCGKAKRVFGIAMPTWEEGLKECFKAAS